VANLTEVEARWPLPADHWQAGHAGDRRDVPGDLDLYLPSYGVPNSRRVDAQHQLDIRIDRTWAFAKWKLSAYLDVSNVYLNAAAIAYQYNFDYTERAAKAARGTTSHFNVATSFDAAVWHLMMVAIVIALLALVAFAILASVRTLDCDPLVATAIRIGAWLLLLTAVSGFAMGGRGQHSVGGVDGAGDALPVTGWSREHGDLRAPHFFAMHGLQVLPLVAFVLGYTRVSERARFAIFVVVATGWILLAVATLFSAFQGRPMIGRSETG
jgi:hypothetical protein